MTKEKTLFILGIWIFCLPYLGFPVFWKNILFVITGVFVSMLSYLMYRHKKVLLKIIEGTDDDSPTKGVISQVREAKDTPVAPEKEHVVFKSEYDPVEDAETPKVSPYNRASTSFKTFYEEKSGPLIHRVNQTDQVDTVRPRTRRKKTVEETADIAV